MSKYQEICAVAANSEKAWSHYEDTCGRHMSELVTGLVTYCEIPSDKVRFLRWNGMTGEQRNYTAPDGEDEIYSLPGAIKYDRTDGYWHLGIVVTLSQLQWVGFVLCVTEESGKPLVKFGGVGTPRRIGDSKQRDEFFDEIVGKLKQSYENYRGPGPKNLGFKEGVKLSSQEDGKHKETAATAH
jgi:hypothetical protein